MNKNYVALVPLLLCAGLASCGKVDMQQSPGAPAASGSSQSAAGTSAATAWDAVPESQFAQVEGFKEDAFGTVDSCSIDLITDANTGHMVDVLPVGSPVTFLGWASAADRALVPDSMYILLKGQGNFAVKSAVGGSLGSAGAGYEEAFFQKYGFNASATTVGVPADSYVVALVLNFGTEHKLCPLWKKLTIR